jgi:threonine dehydrogenase-like Zn-dependent dehydrogenase
VTQREVERGVVSPSAVSRKTSRRQGSPEAAHWGKKGSRIRVTGDPGGIDEAAKIGSLSVRLGLGWAKSHSFTTGQTPVMRYHRGLMQAILHDRVQIAKAVNATVISLDDAPKGYKDFDKGASKKFVLNPHGLIKRGRSSSSARTRSSSGRTC